MAGGTSAHVPHRTGHHTATGPPSRRRHASCRVGWSPPSAANVPRPSSRRPRRRAAARARRLRAFAAPHGRVVRPRPRAGRSSARRGAFVPGACTQLRARRRSAARADAAGARPAMRRHAGRAGACAVPARQHIRGLGAAMTRRAQGPTPGQGLVAGARRQSPSRGAPQGACGATIGHAGFVSCDIARGPDAAAPRAELREPVCRLAGPWLATLALLGLGIPAVHGQSAPVASAASQAGEPSPPSRRRPRPRAAVVGRCLCPCAVARSPRRCRPAAL